MARTNRQVLTGGKKYFDKQKAKHRVEEVVFDKDARKEYLTGFHKRKVLRQKAAAEFNQEQERLAKIEERKRIKEEKQKDIERALDQYKNNVKDLTGVVSDDEDEAKSSESEDDEWTGFEEDEEAGDQETESQREERIKGILKRKEVYESSAPTALPGVLADTDGDEVLTTEVTIESMDPNGVDIASVAASNFVDLTKSNEILKESIDRARKYAKIAGGSVKPSKPKKKKFRYLSKAERRENTRKERSSKHRKRD